jgi:DNA-binding transcriptional ArsR family regulator
LYLAESMLVVHDSAVNLSFKTFRYEFQTNPLITVSNSMMPGLVVHPDANTRALRALEEAGLIAVERLDKRSPRVTLIVEEYAF